MKKITLVLGIILLFSCSKDAADSAINTVTKTALLTMSDWVVVGSQSKLQSATAWTNDFASLPACQKDNKFLFKTNGSLEENEGATKCSASDPQTIVGGTWAFSQNETILVIKEPNSTSTTNYSIESLTSTSLILISTEVVSGVTYQFRLSFSH